MAAWPGRRAGLVRLATAASPGQVWPRAALAASDCARWLLLSAGLGGIGETDEREGGTGRKRSWCWRCSTGEEAEKERWASESGFLNIESLFLESVGVVYHLGSFFLFLHGSQTLNLATLIPKLLEMLSRIFQNRSVKLQHTIFN